MSKILERVIHTQLITYLIDHDLLSPHQHGFRPSHSTQTAILNITERVRSAIDERMVSVLVSFDFSKAFDPIPHRRLLVQLSEIGCDDLSIRWFVDYLSLRSLAVRNADGSHFHLYRTTSGVPQGSVLGPLLFLIYINSLLSILSHSHAIIFADDTQIISHAPPSQFRDLVSRMSADANAVHQWALDNGLSLKAQKTRVLLLGSRVFINALSRANPPIIVLAGTILEYSPSVKIFGLVLDSKLNWDAQISSVSSKIHYALYSLRHHRNSLSRYLRLRLVQVLIVPHLDYAAAALTSLTAEQKLRLQCLQNACIRFIYGNIPRMAHVTPYRLALEQSINTKFTLHDCSPWAIVRGPGAFAPSALAWRWSWRAAPAFWLVPLRVGAHWVSLCFCKYINM
uniref:Reverse transcriptase domain-containing protein n=1 Tax=Trichogramma kaykai TaxID=54128 RepID=A0ABD2WDF7_9HYME